MLRRHQVGEGSMHSRLSVLLAAALAATVWGCEHSSTSPAKTTSGTSHVLLIDAPFPYDRLARVDLYIVSVSGSLSADTGLGNGGGNFVTLAEPRRRINVLALQNGANVELGSLKLPRGAVTAVRMVIDTDSSSITLRDGRVLTGATTPGIAWQSSAGRPTLNALIQEQIDVPDTGAVIVIDYDVGASFIPPQEIDPTSTDSGFVFSPVLRAADALRTGAITGVVRAQSAGGAPVVNASLRLYIGTPGTPENTWPSVHTAKTDSTGAFKFSYAMRSAWWQAKPWWAGATYIVAVDPPSGSSLGRILIPNVDVKAGTVTSLGTVVLP
jgi:hypothetical protein